MKQYPQKNPEKTRPFSSFDQPYCSATSALHESPLRATVTFHLPRTMHPTTVVSTVTRVPARVWHGYVCQTASRCQCMIHMQGVPGCAWGHQTPARCFYTHRYTHVHRSLDSPAGDFSKGVHDVHCRPG